MIGTVTARLPIYAKTGLEILAISRIEEIHAPPAQHHLVIMKPSQAVARFAKIINQYGGKIPETAYLLKKS